MAFAAFKIISSKILIITLIYIGLCAKLNENIGFMCRAQKIRYISTEHPSVKFYDRQYLRYVNLTCQRYGRQTPFYYVGLHCELMLPLHHNTSVHFYFYEFLTNVYKRSFVEMHFGVCQLIDDDKFFGAPLKRSLNGTSCPFLPGHYHLYNMTIDVSAIPRSFPFRKGRIYANVSSLDTKQVIASAHIDMEIKETRSNKRTIGKRQLMNPPRFL